MENHLTIARVAQKWAAEAMPKMDWEGLAVELIEAYGRGELTVARTLEGDEVQPDGHRSSGRPVDHKDLLWRLWDVRDDRAGDYRAAALKVASEFRLPNEELARWCERPGFCAWAALLGLKFPRFVKPSTGPSTVAAETKLRGRLAAMMRDSPEGPPRGMSRDRVRDELMDEFPNLSERAFGRSWAGAIQETGAHAWQKPGPKSNRRTN